MFYFIRARILEIDFRSVLNKPLSVSLRHNKPFITIQGGGHIINLASTGTRHGGTEMDLHILKGI